MSANRRSEELVEASGEVSFSDPLTIFLYLLMRNELAVGKVEELVREAIGSPEERTFANGWLVHYADNLATEIKEAKTNCLKTNLEKAFASDEKEKKVAVVKKEQQKVQDLTDIANEDFGDKTLFDLEQKIIEIAGESKTTESGDPKAKTPKDSAVVAKNVVQHLVESGHISPKDADNLRRDIDDVVVGSENPVGEAEEIVKEHTNEQRWTAEKAKHVVSRAIRAYDHADELDLSKAVEIDAGALQYNNKAVEKKNSVGVAKENTDTHIDNEDWQIQFKVESKKDITHVVDIVDANDIIKANEEKWKNTNEELQKIKDDTDMSLIDAETEDK